MDSSKVDDGEREDRNGVTGISYGSGNGTADVRERQNCSQMTIRRRCGIPLADVKGLESVSRDEASLGGP